MQLTPRQLAIFDYLKTYIGSHRLAPTLQEIGNAFGLSKVTVLAHLRRLEKKGCIERTRYAARGISIPELERGSLVFPLAGTISAGAPLAPVEEETEVDLADLLRPKGDTFLLTVHGDSMIEEGIRDGDLVMVERRSSAADGETVVALLPNGEATLKRLYREPNGFRLQPANASMEPIFADDVEVQGVVVGVVRRYAQ